MMFLVKMLLKWVGRESYDIASNLDLTRKNKTL
jgi:hypothetical protein